MSSAPLAEALTYSRAAGRPRTGWHAFSNKTSPKTACFARVEPAMGSGAVGSLRSFPTERPVSVTIEITPFRPGIGVPRVTDATEKLAGHLLVGC